MPHPWRALLLLEVTSCRSSADGAPLPFDAEVPSPPAPDAAALEPDGASSNADAAGGETASASGSLHPSRREVDFGCVSPGMGSSAMVSLQNAGQAPVGPLTNRLTGAQASAFNQDEDECAGTTLAPGQTCVLLLSFTPSAPIDAAAQLEVTAPGQGTQLSLPVRGLSAARSEAAPEPTSYGFLETKVGTTSAPATFRIRNGTPLPMRTPGPRIRNMSFDVTDDACLNDVLPPGGSCTITVVFKPTSAGEHRGTLEFVTPGLCVAFSDAPLTGRAVP